MEHNQALTQNLFNQVMDIWVLPEIKHRQKEGRLTKPVDLRAAQVLLSISGKNQVRINEEVKAIMEGTAKVPKKRGELIYEGEVEDIRFARLIDEDVNFAHITMMRVKDQWQIAFNFLYGVKDASAILEVGKGFLDSAKNDLANGRPRPAINNLFIAAEQIAKATLDLHPLGDNYRSAKRHGALARAINQYSHITDIIPKEYAEAYNRISRYRDPARYSPTFDISEEELVELTVRIEKLWAKINTMLEPHALDS